MERMLYLAANRQNQSIDKNLIVHSAEYAI